MNKDRKYRLNSINDCYVSSTSSAYLNLLVDVYKEQKIQQRVSLQLQPSGELQYTNKKLEHSFFDVPQYLISDIKEALKEHDWSFYEYDQYGEIRTEGLKYTDEELIISRYIDYSNI